MVSTLSVLLLTLNKALLGGRPRITMFVLLLISHWIKLNYASCFLLRIPKNFSCTSAACRQPASGNERVIHSWFGHALACPRIQACLVAARTVLTSYNRDTEFEVLIALFQISFVSTFQNGSKLEYIYLLCFIIYDVWITSLVVNSIHI